MHPVTVVREALVESLVAIDDEDLFLRHFADTLAVLGQVTIRRVARLRRHVRPEIQAGYDVAEHELAIDDVAA